MDVQAARTALAALAPEGLEGYNHFPGSAELPAMVVGLPERIEPQNGTFRHLRVTLPIYVAIQGNVGVEYEQQLMTHVSSVVSALKGATDGSFKALEIPEIRDFGLMVVGSSEVLAATVLVSLLILN